MAAARIFAEPKPDTIPALPLTLQPRLPLANVATAAVFIAIAAGVLLTPFLVLIGRALTDPAVLQSALRHPLTTLQLALGFLTALAFVTIPLRHLLARTLRPRRIVVAESGVHASNGDEGAGVTWSEPLSAYRGVAHHVRTSLSGTQHEIVLVHPDTAKTVVLRTAPRIAQPEVDAVAALLKLAEVPARSLYGRAPAIA